MRVLIAPDKFAGTLTAVQAADAIAEGWRRHAPGDELDLAPMADGGPGFVDVLHAALGGDLSAVTVSGPHGAPVPAVVLRAGDTAYVESAQAAGLHLVDGDPEAATSRGVGELLLAAVDAGARTVVVGLGGTGTPDGGAGLLAALGATAYAALVVDAGSWRTALSPPVTRATFEAAAPARLTLELPQIGATMPAVQGSGAGLPVQPEPGVVIFMTAQAMEVAYGPATMAVQKRPYMLDMRQTTLISVALDELPLVETRGRGATDGVWPDGARIHGHGVELSVDGPVRVTVSGGHMTVQVIHGAPATTRPPVAGATAE